MSEVVAFGMFQSGSEEIWLTHNSEYEEEQVCDSTSRAFLVGGEAGHFLFLENLTHSAMQWT